MNAIYKFVMAFLAKKSGKTGITTIPRASGINVELTAKQIQKTLESMGVDVSKIKNTKEVQKYLNIHDSWIKQQAKAKAKTTDEKFDALGKYLEGRDTLFGPKKDPFKGWTPRVVEDDMGIKQRMDKIKGMSDRLAKMQEEMYGLKKPTKGNINYEKMEEKLGIKLLRNENLDELVEIEKRIKEGTFPRHQRKYDEAVALEDSKIAKDKYHIPDIIDPEDFAHGGRTGTGLNYLLGEDDQNVRMPFKDGTKFDPKRRTILKGLGALATVPFIGKFFKWAKPLAKTAKVTDLTQVPIKNIEGMPPWFKPLVNQIIKKGDDVTKTHAYKDMQVVHKAQLPESKTEVILTQNIDTGDVVVDIGQTKHGFPDGHLGQPVRLEYKASEIIEPDITKTGKIKSKGAKTKEEFWVEEAEFTGGHPENVKFEESTFEKFGEHGSDFSEVEEFATGLKKGKGGSGHMASGGRVPLAGGKIVGTILSLLKNPKKIRAAVDDIFSTGDYKMDAEMAAEALVENNPAAFGGKLIDDLDDATRSEIYGAVLKVVQSDLAKMLQLKRLSRPTKTLEGIKKTGKINISDPNVADEFTRFMKETDSKGHKKIEEIVEITNFDPKGKKGHATGGLAGLLGE